MTDPFHDAGGLIYSTVARPAGRVIAPIAGRIVAPIGAVISDYDTVKYREGAPLPHGLFVTKHRSRDGKLMAETRHKKGDPVPKLGRYDELTVFNTVTKRREKVEVIPKNKIFTTNNTMALKKTSTKRAGVKRRVGKKKVCKLVRKGTKRPTMKTITSQIRDLRVKAGKGQGKHTYKQSSSSQMTSAQGYCYHSVLGVNTLSFYESATDNLRFFNPSVPATLTTADPTAGTFSHDVHFDSIHSKIDVVNNYQVPVDMKIYLCKVKGQTGSTPIAIYDASDSVLGGVTESTASLLYLTEVETVLQNWDVKCVSSKRLNAGQTASASYTVKDVKYDPSHADNISDAYQKTFKSFVWVVRIQGILGHDAVNYTTEIGLLNASVDIQLVNIAKITYDAGIELNDIFISEGRDTFTNVGTVGTKPVADMIGWASA